MSLMVYTIDAFINPIISREELGRMKPCRVNYRSKFRLIYNGDQPALLPQ